MVCRYPWKKLGRELRVWADSNHAGCLRTRLSTVGGAATWGGQFLKGWSKTVATVCLSSGESELAAVIRGATEGLGMQSVLRDLGRDVDVVISSDATAATGMVRRQGLGRVRHLAVSDLWIQQRVRLGHLKVQKVAGKENPADAYTKVLSREHSEYLLGKLGYVFAPGRPAVAPKRVEKDGLKAAEGQELGCAWCKRE